MSMIGSYFQVDEATLESLRSDPSAFFGFLDGADNADFTSMDVDKAWHAIHFLLNGDAWEGDGPLYDAVMGGEELDDTDNGYGPARILTPDEVKEVNKALERIPPAELERRFNASAMKKSEIYPEIWDDDDGLEYVIVHYEQLREFYKNAAEAGNGMVLALT